jgi:Copper transport outer membrane protein, MctB
VIDFRYHLVSIVAVFLALAIGIVLGAAELQGPTYNFLDRTTAKLQSELGQVTSQRNTAQQQASVGESYAQAIEPAVLHDLLTGQRLLIVTEPGAQSSVVSGISAAAVDAGATVTGQINLQPKFFDTSDTTQDSLNQTNLDTAQPAGIPLDTSGTYQQQAAQVIAAEILTKSTSSDSGSAPSTGTSSTTSPTTSPSGSGSAGAGQASQAQTMLSAYANSGFLNTTGQPATPATLVVVVTPQNAPSDGSADPLDQVLVPVVQELAAKSSALVVAGSSAGSGAGSPIQVLRSNNVANQVSTVDDADFVSGQSVAIQALAILLNGGKAGSYGLTGNGATAVAPSPAPTPAASATPTTTPSTSTKKKKAKK